MSDRLTCPSCSTSDLDPLNDMCDHRHPLCVTCCLDGEHHWSGWHIENPEPAA